MSLCMKRCSNVVDDHSALGKLGQFVLAEETHVACLKPRARSGIVGQFAQKKELIEVAGVLGVRMLGLMPNAV